MDQPAFPRATVERVLGDALGLVLERHLRRAAPNDLLLWSLRGLTVIDPRFDGALQGAQAQLALNGRQISSMPLGTGIEGDPAATGDALGATLANLYGAAWQVSPALRRAGIERMIASGFDEIFNHLDPYSRYVTPAEARLERERRVGQSGLGLRIAVRGGVLSVISLTPQGPAASAGIRRGDKLLAVDGRVLTARDPGLAATLLEGPEGSTVVLTVSRAGKRRDVSLVREVVVPETVSAELKDGILWVRVTGFTVMTERRITAALVDGFATRPPRGVVLDLRGNRGGLLTQAVAVADAFLTAGEVVRTEGRHPDAVRRYEAGGQDLAQGRPVVVLVDGRTASAAEIVAMALSERRRAVVVGSATTGKGLIQLVAPLPNQAEILVTWSEVVAPSGWPIQGLGVLPALCTSLGPEALAQGLSRLNAGQVPMAGPLARQRAARPPVLPSESVALRGACPPAEGRAADRMAAEALISSPHAYGAALAQLLP